MSQVHLWLCKRLVKHVCNHMVAPVEPRQCRLHADCSCTSERLAGYKLISIDKGLLSGLQVLQELSQQHAAELEGQALQASQAAAAQEGRMHTLLAEARQQAQADSRCAATPQAVQCP